MSGREAWEDDVREFVDTVPDVAGALVTIIRFGGIDGDHHKAWVIDQVTRCLTGDNYEQFVQWVCADDLEGEEWDVGVAP